MMSDNLKGMGLMTLAMAFFAVADATIKGASATLPTGQIILLLGTGGLVCYAVLAAVSGDTLLDRAFFHPLVLARNAGEMIARFGIVTSLALTPLASASAIAQSSPILVTLGAVLLINEQVDWRRWVAVILGFVGVIVILRPGLAGFEPASLFAVVGAIGLATRDLASRVTPKNISTLKLAGWAFAVLIPTGVIIMAVGGQPWAPVSAGAGVTILASVLSAAAAMYAVTAATRAGEVSVVSPFRYTRIIFAIGIGIVFFSETPDTATWIGAALIGASGLDTLFRERKGR